MNEPFIRPGNFGDPIDQFDQFLWGMVLISLAALACVIVSRTLRARRRKMEYRQRLASALRYLENRGVGEVEAAAAHRYFSQNNALDPESCVMLPENFNRSLGPFFINEFGPELRKVIHGLLFQPNHLIPHAPHAPRLKAVPPGKAAAAAAAATATAAKAAAAAATAAAAGKAKEAKGAEAAPKAWEGEAPSSGLAFLQPGRAIRVSRLSSRETFETAILASGADHLVIAMPPAIRLPVPEKVEIYLDIGLALCGLIGFTTEVSRVPPPACRIGRFVEGWVVRRRHAVRLPVQQTVIFSHLPVDQASRIASLADIAAGMQMRIEGKLQNISLGGCLIRAAADRPYRNGDLVGFTLKPESGGAPLDLRGAVVRTTPVEEEARINLHIQFVTLDGPALETLAKCLRQWMAHPP